MVPIDTDIRARKEVILRPKATEKGESFLLGKVEIDLVQLLRMCALCSLVRHDCGEKSKDPKETRC